MNQKQGKELYTVWLTKTQSKMLDEALADNEWDNARVLFEQAFMEGLIERR